MNFSDPNQIAILAAVIGAVISGIVCAVVTVFVTIAFARRENAVVAKRLAEEEELKSPFAENLEHPITLPQHFRSEALGRLDTVVFTIKVREGLPIMDVVYLEYLKWLLANNGARHVFVVAFDRKPAVEGGQFKHHVESIFRGYEDHLTYIDGDDFTKHKEIPDLFWSTLDFMGSKEFQEWVERRELKFSSLEVLRAARPGQGVLTGIVEHSLRNSQTVPKIIGDAAALTPSREPSVGVLHWEIAIDRLAVYLQYQGEGSMRYSLHSIAGRTVLASEQQAADNNDPRLRIDVMADAGSQAAKVKLKSAMELSGYVTALRAVLKDNYEVNWESARLVREGRRIVEEENRTGHDPKVLLDELSELDFEVVALVAEVRKQITDP